MTDVIVDSGEALERVAAISYVERTDGRIVVVWNRRYLGWTLPGGLVELGESAAQAQARELKEETGLITVAASLIYDAPIVRVVSPQRCRHAYVFRVTVRGDLMRDNLIGEVELGCPVSWFTRDDFLASCPFHVFYREMFKNLGI
jgi:8-oxo-dGTP pyrophosphatase MutT (NUDIX family)